MRADIKGIELRRRPSQARSAATFDHILATAAIVLEDVGWDGFTTNLLAKRAGVGLQALYRYFPNKLAVVATLTQQMIDDWGSWFDELEAEAQNGKLEDFWEQAFDVFVDGIRNTPGCIAVRRAMSASPQLKVLDQHDNALLSLRMANILLANYPVFEEQEAVSLCRVLIESIVAIVDLSFDMPSDQAELLLRQCKAMQSGYFSQLLLDAEPV